MPTMPKTNVHVHLFTADHAPEIQFFYLLWNVFEGILVRNGIGPTHQRFKLEDVARCAPCLRLWLWFANSLA